MPEGITAMFVAMLALAVLYAMLCKGSSGLGGAGRFTALIALYSVCSFGIHNYVNLNTGIK
jgi:hypothetical protein